MNWENKIYQNKSKKEWCFYNPNPRKVAKDSEKHWARFIGPGFLLWQETGKPSTT